MLTPPDGHVARCVRGLLSPSPPLLKRDACSVKCIIVPQNLHLIRSQMVCIDCRCNGRNRYIYVYVITSVAVPISKLTRAASVYEYPALRGITSAQSVR